MGRRVGITGDEVWQALTVQPHTRLGDHAGVFVAWRGDGVHVSTPADIDPGPDPDVRVGEPSDALSLREHVTPEEWTESGLGDEDVTVAFTLGPPDRLVAAAALGDWADAARDLCVLVHPDHRGQGLLDRVARSGASYAITRHGTARWTARFGNHASTQAARRLGFQAWCTQLAVRLPDVED